MTYLLNKKFIDLLENNKQVISNIMLSMQNSNHKHYSYEGLILSYDHKYKIFYVIEKPSIFYILELSILYVRSFLKL